MKLVLNSGNLLPLLVLRCSSYANALSKPSRPHDAARRYGLQPQLPRLMGSPPSTYAGVPVVTPGLGLGWTKIADAVERVLAPQEIGRIWVFPPLRRDGREWGTAVVAKRVEDDRFTVFTAQYMLTTRGRERGRGRVQVDEVGEGPVGVVHDVIRGVQARSGEGEPPAEIAPELWYGRDDDESPSEA